MAEPESMMVNRPRMSQFLDSIGLNWERDRPLFWQALGLIQKLGLIYEVVMVVTPQAELVPLRVNDHHATQGAHEEPALISLVPGSGFYVNPKAEYALERYEEEGCWFYWPRSFKGCELRGSWRLRFRCATPETARGIERDYASVQQLERELMAVEMLQPVERAA